MAQDFQAILENIASAVRLLAEQRKSENSSCSTTLQNATLLLGTFCYRPEVDQTFQQWFTRNQTISEESTTSEKLRVQLLLKALGPEEYGRLRSRLSPATPESKSYNELLSTLKETFGPSKSLFRRRHDILSDRAPQDTQPEDLLNWANLKGDEFELQNLTPDMFKVFLALLYASGPSFKTFRAVLLKAAEDKPLITIPELREVVRRYTTRVEDTEIFTSELEQPSTSVYRVQHSKTVKSGSPIRPGKIQRNECLSCGGPHERRQCRFFSAVCRFCNKKGHITKVCKTKQKGASHPLNSILICQSNDSADKSNAWRAFATVTINGKPVRVRIDTGADVTTISRRVWDALGAPRLSKMDGICTAVNGQPLEILGYFEAKFGSEVTCEDRVVVLDNDKNVALLGGKVIFGLGLLSAGPTVEISGVADLAQGTRALKDRFQQHFTIFRTDQSQLSAKRDNYKHQFDNHHGVRKRYFTKGEKVTVQLHSGQRVTASYEAPLGNSMARLKVGGKILIRHHNQIWKRTCETRHTVDEDFLPSPLYQTPADLSDSPEPGNIPRGQGGERKFSPGTRKPGQKRPATPLYNNRSRIKMGSSRTAPRNRTSRQGRSGKRTIRPPARLNL